MRAPMGSATTPLRCITMRSSSLSWINVKGPSSYLGIEPEYSPPCTISRLPFLLLFFALPAYKLGYLVIKIHDLLNKLLCFFIAHYTGRCHDTPLISPSGHFGEVFLNFTVQRSQIWREISVHIEPNRMKTINI